MTGTAGEKEIEVTSTVPEPLAPRVFKIEEPEKSKELEPIETRGKTIQSTAEEMRSITQEKPKADQKTTMPERVRTSQVKVVELTSAPTQERMTLTKTAISSSSGCQYGYGYLSQREKGESIPDTCIECPKSLGCMLSEYYKKEESVKEIKKWYSF